MVRPLSIQNEEELETGKPIQQNWLPNVCRLLMNHAKDQLRVLNHWKTPSLLKGTVSNRFYMNNNEMVNFELCDCEMPTQILKSEKVVYDFQMCTPAAALLGATNVIVSSVAFIVLQFLWEKSWRLHLFVNQWIIERFLNEKLESNCTLRENFFEGWGDRRSNWWKRYFEQTERIWSRQENRCSSWGRRMFRSRLLFAAVHLLDHFFSVIEWFQIEVSSSLINFQNWIEIEIVVKWINYWLCLLIVLNKNRKNSGTQGWPLSPNFPPLPARHATPAFSWFEDACVKSLRKEANVDEL